MVGLAFERDEIVFDNVKASKWSKNLQLEFSFFNTITYAYSFIGLMTGPYYKYRTFQDMLYQNGDHINTIWSALLNLKLLPVLVVPYLVLKENFPLEYLESEEFLAGHGFLYSTYVVACTAWWFRWRFHIGWLLAESVCIATGLGAYPFEAQSKPGKGPTVFDCPDAFEVKKLSNDKETHW